MPDTSFSDMEATALAVYPDMAAARFFSSAEVSILFATVELIIFWASGVDRYA